VTATSQTASRSASHHGGRRFSISLLFALILHAIAFIIVQWMLPREAEEEFEYTGPLYVTIEEYEPEIAAIAPETTEVSVTAPETAPAVPPVEAAPPKETAIKQEPRPAVPRAIEKPKPTLSTTQESIQRPTTMQEAEPAPEERITEGVRRVIIPAEEKLPAGLEVPTLEESAEPAAIPPEFLTKEEDKPLHFDVARLDDTLVTEKGRSYEQPTRGTSGSVRPGADTGQAGSKAAAPGAPVITWEEEGQKRVLLSPVKRPDIPSWVKEEGLDLRVVVSFAVTPEGHTTSLKVERSSGYSDVDASVLETVRKLIFNPVTEDRNVLGRIDYVIRTK
jgi:TonB family protein